MAFPKPLRSDDWAAIRQIAEHWAPSVEGYAADDLTYHLLRAAEKGDVPAEFVNVALGGDTYHVAEVGGLRGFFARRVEDGFSKEDLILSMLRGGPVGLALHRDGVLAFAALNGFPPPPWWAAAGADAGNEGQRKQAGTWQRESCEAAFAALYPAGIPDRVAMTNQKLLAEVESYLNGLGLRVPSDDTILREAGRKPRRGGK